VSKPPPAAQKLCQFVLVVRICAGFCRFLPFCAAVPFFCVLTDCSPPFSAGRKKSGQKRGQLVSKPPFPPEKDCVWFFPNEYFFQWIVVMLLLSCNTSRCTISQTAPCGIWITNLFYHNYYLLNTPLQEQQPFHIPLRFEG